MIHWERKNEGIQEYRNAGMRERVVFTAIGSVDKSAARSSCHHDAIMPKVGTAIGRLYHFYRENPLSSLDLYAIFLYEYARGSSEEARRASRAGGRCGWAATGRGQGGCSRLIWSSTRAFVSQWGGHCGVVLVMWHWRCDIGGVLLFLFPFLHVMMTSWCSSILGRLHELISGCGGFLRPCFYS